MNQLRWRAQSDDGVIEATPPVRSPDGRARTILAREGTMIITDTRPIDRGQQWISVITDGCELERRGPFPDTDAAEVMARQLATICRSLFHGDWPMPTEINDGRNR